MSSQFVLETVDVLAKSKKQYVRIISGIALILSPPQLFKPEGLLLLPILIVVSLSTLLLTFVVPPIYRKIRNLISPPQYDLLVDEDETEAEPAPYMPSGGLIADFKIHVRTLKEYGTFLFFMEILRTLAIVALLGLSIHAAIQAEAPESSHRFDITKKHRKHKHKHNKLILGEYTPQELGEFGTVTFYVSGCEGLKADPRHTPFSSPFYSSRSNPPRRSDDN